MKTRRALLGCIFCPLARPRGRGAGALDHGRFHDIDRAIRSVQSYPAGVHGPNRHSGQGRRARHRTGARRRPARGCRRGFRARPDRGGRLRGGGVRRTPLRRHVQRFRRRRAEERPRGAAGRDVAEALRRIAAAGAPFISRGDRSGTHAAELRFWREAGADPGKSEWYKEIGQGMGPALNVASASNAYLLTDRGTWLSFRNRGELTVLVEGDRRLFNPYGVMLVNPARHPHVKAAEGQRFIEWLLSTEGQGAIASFRIDGEPLFFPNAGGPVRS